jgi:RNA polymerase sigma factor (sigma-70 family)
VTSASASALDGAFQAHERLLWHLCYRMTGVAADADDLVQETFLRAMERPPADSESALRPWLVRVAMNLARDQLRRRRRRGWTGPWLPSPIETAEEEASPAYEPASTEGRYDLLESCTFAFLLALEALTPQQRAVLLLRDVFDYSVAETAAALDLTDANVKTTHHRARRAMAAYDASRRPPTRTLQETTRRAVARLMDALARGDARTIEAALAPDVRALSDGGGEFHAARKPVVGRERVAHVYRRLTELGALGARVTVRMLNGLPGLVIDFGRARPGYPPRGVIRFDLDESGLVVRVHSVLATRKLTAVRFGRGAAEAEPGRGTAGAEPGPPNRSDV